MNCCHHLYASPEILYLDELYNTSHFKHFPYHCSEERASSPTKGLQGRFVFCMVVLCITCLISMYVLGYGYIHLAEVVKSMEYSVTFPAKTSDTL